MWEIVIHVGNPDLWAWVVERMMRSDYPRDVVTTVTFSLDSAFQNGLQQAALQALPNVQLVLVENRGVDVGAFFQLLRHWRVHSREWPSFVLKLHTKSDKAQRTLLWDQLLRYGPMLVRWMEHEPSIVIATTTPCTIQQGEWGYRNTSERLKSILKRLSLPVPHTFKKPFPYATHFVLRMAALERVVSSVDQLERELQMCSTPYQLDTVWYTHPAVHPSLSKLDASAATWHYETVGRRSGMAPNCFTIINKRAMRDLRISERQYAGVMRDGMVEHAWERAFAHLGTLLAYDPFEHMGRLFVHDPVF